jgi:hypothetical protein
MAVDLTSKLNVLEQGIDRRDREVYSLLALLEVALIALNVWCMQIRA